MGTASHALRGTRLLKAVGFLVGAFAVSSAILAWRVPLGDGVLPAELTVIASPTGELDVQPTGALLAGHDLRSDGRSARARFSVRNQTGRTLAVRVRAPVDTRDLDRIVEVALRGRGVMLYRGPLGGLRRSPSGRLLLRPGGAAAYILQVWIPRSVGERYRGRFGTAPLTFDVRPVDTP
jgi:hypothetical protein